jgi:hypothetical protein
MNGTDFDFKPVEIWSGTTLSELSNAVEFEKLTTNLQNTYKNDENFANLPEYATIVSQPQSSVAILNFAKNLLETNV